jgi:hypothetical protein
VKVISFVSSLLRIAGLFWLGSVSSLTFAQGPVDTPTSVTALMRQMAGTWEVQARMWPGPNAKAVELPPAIAHRELIRDAYLQETMEPKQSSEGSPFTRVAYFSYNWINRQYEYFSLDSRLPQMMSYVIPGANKTHDGGIDLVGTSLWRPSGVRRRTSRSCTDSPLARLRVTSKSRSCS